MGMLSKFAFWKKADPFGDVPGQAGLGNDPFANSPLNDPSFQGMNQGSGADGFGSPIGQPSSAAGPGFDPYGQGAGAQDKPTPFAAGPNAVPMGAPYGSQQGMSQQQGYPNQQGYPQSYPDQSQASQAPTAGPDLEKDLQIISLKLDTIKGQLDNIRIRVEKIERIADMDAVKAKKIEYGW